MVNQTESRFWVYVVVKTDYTTQAKKELMIFRTWQDYKAWLFQNSKDYAMTCNCKNFENFKNELAVKGQSLSCFPYTRQDLIEVIKDYDDYSKIQPTIKNIIEKGLNFGCIPLKA